LNEFCDILSVMERGIKRQLKLKERRLKAVVLFEKGVRQADVARKLRVSKQAVSQWCIAWRQGNDRLLNGAPRAGRPARLGKQQLMLIEKELVRGAAANGFATDLWTLPRVASMIKKVTGVSYHPAHVWKILTEKLAWSVQRPALRARERDEQKVQEWIQETWEEVKKTPKNGVHG
jgi:transposase